jgi:hypothetical protein
VINQKTGSLFGQQVLEIELVNHNSFLPSYTKMGAIFIDMRCIENE